jgi:hypothetical protein
MSAGQGQCIFNMDGSRSCTDCFKQQGYSRFLFRVPEAIADRAGATAALAEERRAAAQEGAAAAVAGHTISQQALDSLRRSAPDNVQLKAAAMQEKLRGALPALVQQQQPEQAEAAGQLSQQLHVCVVGVKHVQKFLPAAWEETVLQSEERRHAAEGKPLDPTAPDHQRLEHLRSARLSPSSLQPELVELLQQQMAVMVFVEEGTTLLLQHLLVFHSLHSNAVLHGRWGTDGATLHMWTHGGFCGRNPLGEEYDSCVKFWSGQLIIAVVATEMGYVYLTLNPQAPLVSVCRLAAAHVRRFVPAGISTTVASHHQSGSACRCSA